MTQSGTSSGLDTETPGGTTPYNSETPVEDEESGDAPEQSAAVEGSEARGNDSGAQYVLCVVFWLIFHALA